VSLDLRLMDALRSDLELVRRENEWLWWLVRSDFGRDTETPAPSSPPPSECSSGERAAVEDARCSCHATDGTNRYCRVHPRQAV
jgi:hypothetical protein